MSTLQQSVDWARSVLVTYIPLTAQAGGEPAVTIANMVVAFINAPPFTWPTNRAENSSLVAMTPGTQDYLVAIADFGFLETVTLTNPANQKSFAVQRIYNSTVLGVSNEQVKRPDACCVKLWIPETNVTFRFMSAPDLGYSAIFTYQKAPAFFTATSQDWFTQANLPPNQVHIYNNLFLGECFQVNGDEQSAAIYRRRGMAALLATAEGLTEMQKSMIFAQAMFSDLQTIAATLRTQAASQARTI